MQLAGRKIFVVEDDAPTLAVVSFLLEHEGALVHRDDTGTEAVRLIREQAPLDAILVDMFLPGNVDGFQILAQLRADPELRAIPVVLLTGTDAVSGRPRAREAGFDGYIAKPVDYDTFGALVADVVAGGALSWDVPLV